MSATRRGSTFLADPRDELTALNAIDVYADPANRAEFLRQIGVDGFVRDEVRFKRKNGAVFESERTVVPIKDASGNVIAYQGIIRDIAERKRADDALRRSESYNRSIVEVIPDIIIRISAKGELLDVVASPDEELAVPRDEIPGKTIADILSTEDAIRAKRGHRGGPQNQVSCKPWSTSWRCLRGRRWFEARFSPSVTGRSGRPDSRYH